MHFAERVKLSLADNVFTVPAHVISNRGGQSIIDDQRIATGGSVNFIIRYTPRLKSFFHDAASYTAEFLRWAPGLSFSIESAEMENGGRYLLISCSRSQ